ncbi:hypothetical protein ONZ45_g5875 [Pleurotus djamor]|nr:hypothetical protein ONZ45_g5875 [Pleurotus djamor]
MWSKLSSALGRHRHESDASASSSQSQRSEVMDKVYEQHPNLSVFHGAEEETSGGESPEMPFPNNPSPPSSPSRNGRLGMFKRSAKSRDDDSIRAPSPLPSMLPSIGLPKKVRSTLSLRHNSSQQSLSRASGNLSRPSQDTLSRPSTDTVSPSSSIPPRASSRASGSIRSESPFVSPQASSSKIPLRVSTNTNGRSTPSPLVVDTKYSSVRSILRGPNTPGTGQNVRFFSRDAYKVLSPDESLESEISEPRPSADLLDRFQHVRPEVDDNESPRSSSPRSASFTKSRPSLANVFSPLTDSPRLELPTVDESNLFDVSQHMDIPVMTSDLDIKIPEPSMEPPEGLSESVGLTSTPFGKGKPKDELVLGQPIDDTIFHSLEKSPELPPVLHDRSQSFSFGQTVFFSMNQEEVGQRSLSPSVDSPAGSLRRKLRNRAMSDTNLLRSPPKAPEADINDERSTDLIIYSQPKADPDPFSANANTYYTPQTMIPTTPPQGPPRHARKSSKEEGIIASLQTQLTLQTELCSQYETDLQAKDELVQLLNKKLSELEKEDSRRRGVLRTWKKKVAELEKACRYLEEEVDNSRQASFERSVMDEASGEALRMLHRQIAGLEREKVDWSQQEADLQTQVARLSEKLQEREDEIVKLQEVGQTQRELQEGILGISQQWEQMGNTSIGTLDDTILRKLNAPVDPEAHDEAVEQLRVAQLAWDAEKAELVIRAENVQVEKAALAEELNEIKDRLTARDEEYKTLKTELEAQWQHTESTSERMQGIQQERDAFELERDSLKLRLEDVEKQVAAGGSQQDDVETLKKDFADLEQRYADLDLEFNEREEQRGDLEEELNQVNDARVTLEAEKHDLEEALQQELDRTEELSSTLQERDKQLEEERDRNAQLSRDLRTVEDRVAGLIKEQEWAQSNITRLETIIQQRDNEIDEYSKRILDRESEAAALREQMTNMKREHTRALDEQTRRLQDTEREENDSRSRMESLVKERTEATFEANALKGRVDALNTELEKLRRQVHDLKQESADKEVKIVQLTKSRNQDKEDMQGLNIALDSKQQELELIKRKLGVRGTAGSTPAQPSKAAHHRRDSSAFSTPSVSRPPSRPPSVISETGLSIKANKTIDTPAASGKIPALGRSTRANTTITPSVVAKAARAIEGSMGPPPPNKRLSLTSTPTPSGRVSSLSRKISAGPSAFPAPPTHKPLRRTSSSSLDKPSSASSGEGSRNLLSEVKLRPVKRADSSPDTSSSSTIQQNKENVGQRSMVPA